jgi:6-phosphogluconate dehydrogenase
MQLISEAYGILKSSAGMNNIDIAKVLFNSSIHIIDEPFY